MNAYHRVQLPPTGVSHALSVRLTAAQDTASTSDDGTVVSHLVTARNHVLQVFEVREYEPVSVSSHEAPTARLHHLVTRRLHGTVTSLARIRTLASKTDGADRVLVSFKDAKLSLLEWTASAHDLLPVSLHTFEKLPQVAEGSTLAATDPASRLSVLLLPSNTGGDGTLAILPFFQEEIDLDSLGVDAEAWGPQGIASLVCIPYAPSHLLPLASLTATTSISGPARSSTLSNSIALVGGTPPIRNVIDIAFLPGFNEPTLAILYAPEQTWAGRLENVSNNCLVSLVTLATGTSKGTDSDTTAVVIATSPPLPHTCLSIHPCPPDLGGALILTANGVIHLEQGGKLVGVAANGWFVKDWPAASSSIKPGEATTRDELEGARIVFVSNSKAIVFAKSGSVFELSLVTSGRSISSMNLKQVGRGVPASCVERIRGSKGRFGEMGYVFVGSHAGESSLLSWQVGATNGTSSELASSRPTEMDFDDLDDIYGASDATKAPPTTIAAAPARVLAGGRSLLLTPCDVLEHYGSIRSLAVGLVGDDSPVDLVASTGQGPTSGLTVFHRTIAPRKRRRLDSSTIATNGVWALNLKGQHSPILISSDASTTRFTALATTETEPTELSGPTIAAFASPDGTSIIRITPAELHVLDADLSVRHSRVFTRVSLASRAIMSQSLVAVFGPSDKVEVFVYDITSGDVAVFDAVLSYTSSALAVTLFSDSTRAVPLVRSVPQGKKNGAIAAPDTAEDEDDLYTTAPRRTLASETKGNLSLVIEPTVQNGALATHGQHPAWQWMPLVDEHGDLQIVLLPNLQVVFSATAIALFPDVIQDGQGEPVPENIDEDDIQIDRVLCGYVGQSRLRAHLVVLLKNGAMAVYEAMPSITAGESSRPDRTASLGVRFVKMLTKRLPLPVRRKAKRGLDEEEPLPSPRREFIPFINIDGFSGWFVTGDDPFWFIASDHGPVRYVESSEKNLYGFSPSANGDGYLVQSKDSLYAASLPYDVCFDREMPYQRVPKDRRYAAVTFDLDSGLYVAGALYDTVFMNFDDEGKPVYVNENPEITDAHNFRSTLELIMPGTWKAIDGFEFRPNEFVSTLKTVTLSSKSTATGRKDFIAVGTTVFRAEDLAARGGIYLFEVVPIVPSPERPYVAHKLKRLLNEDTKSVVGNICDINGHLIMSMGQKLYARALEQDEVFIAVGFFDVGVHVTSLTATKNFLLIGDALQSVTLVAFQEDPYKLVLLGRDYRPVSVSNSNFLVNDGKVALVVGDLDGVLRMFEYDPLNISSYAGQRLLCRTEYATSSEAQATILFARRSSPTEDLKQNGILYGTNDGSLMTLVPVRDIVFKRLQSLQMIMMKSVLHFGGLNPRGFRYVHLDLTFQDENSLLTPFHFTATCYPNRIVKNDSVSRAMAKGILDGELLAEFEALSLGRQMELCEMIHSDPDTVLANLRGLMSW
ncbi:BZ3500_MvSof-1268-A1-R1_Chr9g10894 [Microbotryum saponariae]|uniref:BZ3500_MvSof-1268-A1-R1_Chr9g10894 protein n=1 Tax=Microbotryum saponariae TaxID=289078 RepID=A0A2X0KWA0_9BASI|nr:BZ3501_MvSof-1269-A2-R1_Chr9g10642 [Microbotryum saponariae]SDA00875.1 BZ3500_MvSof-1268-A1-R1_Chr9g10894 [Microbotryum saponariae]